MIQLLDKKDFENIVYHLMFLSLNLYEGKTKKPPAI